ncbi:MAG TPA: FAD-binding oxidoreductase [Gaiellaceae bacterium]|jgi:FAD/FMN-containing dehydrogenase|nr:FAD-binding oxidoreductase [Gaiellaceae bacterium]
MSATATPVIGEATIQELREAIRGEVITPGDAGFGEASRVWNGMHDARCPAVIVRCAGAADVAAAIGFARSNQLKLAIRGGAHSIAGFSTCDGGVVVDLSQMKGVRVDPGAQRAHVGGGATWLDVDHETQPHGLATTGGLVSSTGVGGYTLGGGIGWLMRAYGLACDNLVGADVVTADGQLVHASETENPDLLWGLRGGGGNFGVVTQFELALHPVGPLVHAGPIFYPAEAAVDLMRLFRDWAPDAPDEVTALVNLTSAPPLPPIPEAWHGKPVAAFVGCSVGPVEEAEAHVRAFRTVAEPIADLLGPMPYNVIQTLLDPLWGKGTQAYFKATNLSGLDDALIERLAEVHLRVPGPQAEIHIHQMGGAVGRVADGATSFSERSMPYVLNAVTGWHDAGQADSHIAWARAVVDAAGEASTGRAYVNYLGDPGAGRSAYGTETYERLAALKREYDPTNVFRLNQNIEP